MKNQFDLDFFENYRQHVSVMSHDAADHELLDAWKTGDQMAAERLFQRYQTRLLALIRSRLSRKLARRIDPEDILLSAYRSFFIATRQRQRIATANDDLWPLLTTFALRKLARQARRHTADRRSIDREEQEFSAWLESAIHQEPTAEHAVAIEDELEQLMARLDETAREVLVLTLQGQDVNAIADVLAIHEQSVRRALERIRRFFPTEKMDLSWPRSMSASREQIATRITPKSLQGTVGYDQYLLQQLVGTGAFSKVYRGIDRSSGEMVAVKFLRKDCWRDPRATASFIREHDILRQLNHPDILSSRGWGTTRRGALFLVSDFIEGMNLAEWRRMMHPDLHQLIRVVCQVSDAVSAAHARGILHGDLKPANVMMRTDGRVVLCDFGLARYANDPDDVPRGGTAGFLAPEQISDAFGPVTEQSDVYGLGGLLYALLTGRAPFTGRDLPGILANVLSVALPEPPSQHSTPSVAGLDGIALRCLAKEPAQRFSSAAEVAKALANLVLE